MVRAAVVNDGDYGYASQYEAIRADYARRVQVPATYSVYQQDSTIYADHCFGSGTDFDDTTLTAVLTKVFDNGLSSGRTYKEKVVVKGNFTGLEQITIPSYTVFEVQGYLKAKNALNDHFITNSDPTGGNTDITLQGGFVDANKANQAADMSCIHLENVTRPEVYFMKVAGGNRPVGTDSGEGICFWNSTLGKIIGNYCYDAYYDNIKIRGGSTHNVIANNTCVDSETKGGIQVSSNTTAHNNVVGNTIYQNAHALDNGIRVHNAHNNLIADNHIYAYQSSAVQLVDSANNNTFTGNHVYTNDVGFHTYTAGATGPLHNFFKGNTVNLATNAAAHGFFIDQGTYNEVWNNSVRGATGGVGVEFGAATCNYNRLGPNYYYDLTTNVTIAANTDVEFIDCQNFSGSTCSALAGGTAQAFGCLVGKASAQNDEAQERQVVAKAGIFRNAYVKTNANVGVGETLHVIYRKNGADQNIDVSMTGAVSTGSDRNHGFSCAAEDLICVRITETGGVGALHIQWGVQFIPF